MNSHLWPRRGNTRPYVRPSRWAKGMAVLAAAGLLAAVKISAAESAVKPGSTWPQEYTVQRDDAAGTLVLRTPYYTIEHDLKRGGAIRRITLVHGKAPNLLVAPVASRVRDESGVVLDDLHDAAAKVTHRREGLNAIVTVESTLAGAPGQTAAPRVKSVYEYRWGYIKIHKEFSFPTDGYRARELCPIFTVLDPSLAEYGYREGLAEEQGAPPFDFGSSRWGKLRSSQPADPPLDIRFVPRSMMFANPGIEGLEWFAGSDLVPWEWGFTGQRGQGRCLLEASRKPPGLALSIAPLWSTNQAVALTNVCAFDFYLAVPLLEGHARNPWLHSSFNRNRGEWLPAQEIRRLAEQGIQTLHCHNDGDYYDDGLFWRDGAYPPYPDMDRYDQVLKECRQVGIRTATYFSNKELHPSTPEFQNQGRTWSRQNRRGEVQHNMYRGSNEFGAQMCLRSGWLGFLKSSIDRVLKNHPLDGVYYDWNVALYCRNPAHEGGHDAAATAQGHWDIDELLDLMEWTRQRVGPGGLVIIHNTTTPMFATENFADDIVATEWGYQKWTDRAPAPDTLPLEWTLAGARSRGVISYGTLDSQAPRRLHRLFALEAFLGNSTPWPASPETFELLPFLKPLGNLEAYRFADWRNSAVRLNDGRCASAVYSRPGEAFLLLVNLEPAAREVTCVLHPDQLPYPLDSLETAERLPGGSGQTNETGAGTATRLDVRQLTGSGIPIVLPGDGALVIRVR